MQYVLIVVLQTNAYAVYIKVLKCLTIYVAEYVFIAWTLFIVTSVLNEARERLP